MIQKHLNLLKIKESLKEIFNCQPITAFRRNKNLKELIGSNKIEKNIVKKKRRKIQKLKSGKFPPYLTNLRSLCCKQVRKPTTFKSQQTKKICKHFQQESPSFKRHATFTIVGQLTKTFTSKETPTQRLIEKDVF